MCAPDVDVFEAKDPLLQCLTSLKKAQWQLDTHELASRPCSNFTDTFVWFSNQQKQDPANDVVFFGSHLDAQKLLHCHVVLVLVLISLRQWP